jgi:hypothetical protein
MYCAKCGTLNDDTAAFCKSCGNNLRIGSSAPPAPTTSPAGAVSGPRASFTITSAFRDAIALARSPVSFMTINRDNDVSMKTLMINYVAVLAAIPFVATLIGDSWYYRFFTIFGSAGFGYIFGIALLTYVLNIVAVFVVGFVMWKLAPSFGTNTNQERATRMAAYVFTPAFLLSIFDIIPFLGLIAFLGVLYGLYIMYLGLPIVMGTPKEQVITYLIVTVIATIVVYAIVGFIISLAIGAFVVSSFLLVVQ